MREEQTLRQHEKRQHRTTWQHWGKSPQAFPQQLHTPWYHPLWIDPWTQTKNNPHADSITQISEAVKDWILNTNWVNGRSVTQKYRFSQKGVDRGIWHPLRCVDLRRWQPLVWLNWRVAVQSEEWEEEKKPLSTFNNWYL